MLPLLGVLGSFAIANLERQAILNVIRWGLTTLGASYTAYELKKDVFGSKPQKDVLGSGSSSSSSVPSTPAGGKLETDDGPAEISTSTGGDKAVNTPHTSISTYEDTPVNVSLSVSPSGDNLLDVLKNNGEITKEGLEGVISSIEGVKGVFKSGLSGIESAIRDLQVQSQPQTQLNKELLEALRGIGAILGAIGMSLEGIRQTLETQRTEVKVSFPQNVGVKILSLPSEVSRYMEKQVENGQRVADALTSEVSIDAEKPVVGGKVLEVIAKSLGVQSQTFADINTFEVSDGDLPDLPADIDLSKIFEFLKVSSQIKGE